MTVITHHLQHDRRLQILDAAIALVVQLIFAYVGNRDRGSAGRERSWWVAVDEIRRDEPCSRARRWRSAARGPTLRPQTGRHVAETVARPVARSRRVVLSARHREEDGG